MIVALRGSSAIYHLVSNKREMKNYAFESFIIALS